MSRLTRNVLAALAAGGQAEIASPTSWRRARDEQDKVWYGLTCQ